MPEDHSGKPGIVERETVGLDQGHDVRPILSDKSARGLMDRMELERDHGDHSRRGDGFRIDLREHEGLVNPVIDEHEVERRKREIGMRLELMEIRGLGEKPVAKV